MWTPEQFPESRMDVKDFDGTEFNTFETDPQNGIYGVDEAYLEAVDATFSASAVVRYEDAGGHRNRTPREIVKELIPGAPAHIVDEHTDNLVRVKLHILEGQIGKGSGWPKPVPGFLEYSHAISDARENGIHIVRAVVSSGHTTFIKKCYAQYGIQEPDILVTYENTAGINSNIEPELLAKPNLFPLKLALLQWKMMYGISNTSDDSVADLSDRITVVGDSVEKDGGLARNAGTEFILIKRGNELAGWQRVLGIHGLGSAAMKESGLNLQ